MGNSVRKRFLVLFLLAVVLGSGIVVCAEVGQQRSASVAPVYSELVLRQAFSACGVEQQRGSYSIEELTKIEAWLNDCPLVEFACRIGRSMTVKFMDGSYTVIMSPLSSISESFVDPGSSFIHETYGNGSSNSAVVLNTAEYVYGHRQCKQIINVLLRHDYQIEYLANDAVDLSYLRYNLSADIVYMNTHAGYFDVDGDGHADAVVIATGEQWTNDTEEDYAFEYEHQMIVKGMVGNRSLIAFTPAFIQYYYPAGRLPGSLVYMATCYATYDASMAEVFLDAGADAYMGWEKETVFLINSRTSVAAFYLFSAGLSVHQVCVLIRYGGLYNRLFHSKLTYYGDGEYQIPQ